MNWGDAGEGVGVQTHNVATEPWEEEREEIPAGRFPFYQGVALWNGFYSFT